MTPDAPPLARRIFQQALKPGPTWQPVSVAAVLERLETLGDSYQLNVDELEVALDAEFPWRNQLVFQSYQLDPEELETWTQVIRWLMRTLLVTDISTNGRGSLQRFQVLLTALSLLDVGCEGLSAVSSKLGSSHVPLTLVEVLQKTEQIPESSNARFKQWLRELPRGVKAGNFKMLQQAQRVLQPKFRADIWTYVFLLWKLKPEQLARFIKARDSILWDILICMVLDANAPQFALRVESVTFKFISLSWLGRMKDIYPETNAVGVHEQLLLQVAKTPHWKGWLEANYAYPTTGSEHSQALAEALAKLTESHWKEFIFALALSKSGNSAAEAVADILTNVERKIGSTKAKSIWLEAFERWNAWDYGSCEEHFFLSSPQVCTFDFPVAKHYSLMSVAQREALQHELEDAILHIEQRWFSSELELCTERNRLASRLRLIRHGSTLASDVASALPPPVQPDSEYAEVRYRYHDINAPLTS
ncbi:hypothetical protein [Pusillimonas sp. NJUB218]|uniref:hypothetical protein n=1 Tax=Pusillimonas sp. NJUB218 TaxID=2023230 RepID=UPI000F4BA5CD|nr:hypothetical protein [Pusillimonas sp. NJUB218]ROT43936.1 hypothetical protein CHR62_15025 [Pusillimonas sp. NJUB218]